MRRGSGPHLVLEGPQVASPGVGVAIIFSLLPKVASQVAIDNSLGQDDTLTGGRDVGACAHEPAAVLTFLLELPSSAIIITGQSSN